MWLSFTRRHGRQIVSQSMTDATSHKDDRPVHNIRSDGANRERKRDMLHYCGESLDANIPSLEHSNKHGKPGEEPNAERLYSHRHV